MSLTGKTVVVTRSAKASQNWIKKLTDLGAKVYNLPTITMSPVEPDETLINILRSLDQFDWIVFTSASGISYLSQLNKQLGLKKVNKRFPAVAAIGSRTAAEAISAGLKVTFEPSESDSQYLAQELPIVKNQRILLLRTTIASDDLPTSLQRRGAIVTDARIYQTAVLTSTDPTFSKLLRTNKVDFITFASSSAVAGFMARVGEEDLEYAKRVTVVAIGPGIVERLNDAGFSDVYMTKTASLDAIAKVLDRLAT